MNEGRHPGSTLIKISLPTSEGIVGATVVPPPTVISHHDDDWVVIEASILEGKYWTRLFYFVIDPPIWHLKKTRWCYNQKLRLNSPVFLQQCWLRHHPLTSPFQRVFFYPHLPRWGTSPHIPQAPIKQFILYVLIQLICCFDIRLWWKHKNATYTLEYLKMKPNRPE